MMKKAKKNSSETVHEYLIRMREIGSMYEVDDKSVIKYVINGINDEPENKAMLYGADDLSTFKRKLFAYSEFKETVKSKDRNSDKIVQNNNNNKRNAAKGDEKRCFSCGIVGHVINDCPTKTSGPKCFKCSEYGHISPKCPNKANATIESRGYGYFDQWFKAKKNL